MPNIIDYAKYYGIRTFEEVPFNDIDALILGKLSYLNFSEVKDSFPNTIEKISKDYFYVMTNQKIKSKKNVYKYTHNLFGYIKNTARFKDIEMINYERIVDSEKQFGAITFKYNDWIYISYEGTNEYISGWREDFDLSNKYPVPSQQLAIDYLNAAAKGEKRIYVGGHSKGGNLSVVASMEAKNSVKEKIVTVYDFDGPGVREKEFNSEKFQQLIPKIKKYVPKGSLIGMILYSTPNYYVVDSNYKGISQHHAVSWQCFGSYFILEKQNKSSLNFSQSIKEFLKDNSEKDIRSFVETIFDILNESDITTTETVTLKKIIKCINCVRTGKLDENTKDKLLKLFNIVLALYSGK